MTNLLMLTLLLHQKLSLMKRDMVSVTLWCKQKKRLLQATLVSEDQTISCRSYLLQGISLQFLLSIQRNCNLLLNSLATWRPIISKSLMIMVLALLKEILEPTIRPCIRTISSLPLLTTRIKYDQHLHLSVNKKWWKRILTLAAQQSECKMLLCSPRQRLSSTIQQHSRLLKPLTFSIMPAH